MRSANTGKEIHQKTLPFYKKQKNYQNLIEMSKLSSHKKQTEYLNQSRDATQFCWHRYEKIIGRKTNNTVEPNLIVTHLHTFLMMK